VQRRLSVAVVALATAAALAACGGGPPPPSQPESERQWLGNVTGVVEQLRHDLGLIAVSGRDVAAARAALGSDSDLYALVLAYTDFGGCAHMVGSAGTPSPGARRVSATLAGAWVRLERSAVLFTRAVAATSPRLLLAAARAAAGASPLLFRATEQLARLRARGQGQRPP
jgi:hypothetical protein